MSYPYKLKSVYMELVWGGNKFKDILNRKPDNAGNLGESWEVCDHKRGISIVTNGIDAGMNIRDIIARDGENFLGKLPVPAPGNRFPLMVKYIDAGDSLSVHVHPDDEYGMVYNGEPGKTEMWYIMQADENSEIIAGLTQNTTIEDFEYELNNGDPGKLLHRIKVVAGDSIFIPAGRIHAITKGVFILEIQQNSDSTFRFYDWGRVGLDGKPRELHLKEAFEVSDWHDYEPTMDKPKSSMINGTSSENLAHCQYFTVDKYNLLTSIDITPGGKSFHIINCVSGKAKILWNDGEETVNYGDTVLIPASMEKITLIPDDNHCVIIDSYVS